MLGERRIVLEVLEEGIVEFEDLRHYGSDSRCSVHAESSVQSDEDSDSVLERCSDGESCGDADMQRYFHSTRDSGSLAVIRRRQQVSVEC